jgi:hypothetical protein
VKVDEVDEEQLKDIMVIMEHLQDVMVRIVFKILGYGGTYQPTMVKMLVAGRSVDWVTPTTPASDLGFK